MTSHPISPSVPSARAPLPLNAPPTPVARFGGLDPSNLQASLLTLVLRVSAVLGLVVYVPSVWLGLQQHLYGLVFTDTVAMITVIALSRYDRLPFRLRASTVCVIYYALGVGLLMSVGAISQIYLFGFSIVTMLLFDLRVGLGAAVLSSLSLFAVGVLGHAAAEMTVPGVEYSLIGWLVITINFTLVNVLLTLAVGAVLTAVRTSLSAAVANGASLERERTLLRTLIDTLPDVVFTKDAVGRFAHSNPATLALFGVEREDQVADKTVFDLFPPEMAAPYHDDDMAVMDGRAVVNREERSIDSHGRHIWYLTTKVPLRGAAGEVVGLIAICRDITDRKQAEADRARLLSELQLQVARMPLAYVMTDRDLRCTRWNPAAERMFGFSETGVLGAYPFDLIAPLGATARGASLLDDVRSGLLETQQEAEHLTAFGTAVVCEWHRTPMFDDEGGFVGLLSLGEDVTARKKLEGQLRQAQKMEAVGQLAGGVAHDFNNLLSVVLSYSELVLDDLKVGDPMRDDVDQIRRAGLRAASLTRQLLMFSRQQVVQPKVLDINELVGGIEPMLSRLLGADIELTSVPGEHLGRVRADAGSLEQVMLNLVVNARDAMPTGGRVTVETANITLDAAFVSTHLGAKPGEYVMMSVTDTGLGMDRQTLARVFEPFFTTKELGKGTGLGLSTAFGIVQQSEGTIWVYSEPGLGTTVKMYLPRLGADMDSAPDTRAATVQAAHRGSETILLVEDEEPVRAVARDILRRHGYTVIEARSGDDALVASEQHDGLIHLLLTDIVMPRMSGPVLAQRLTTTRPEMRLLFMSGYTGDAVVRDGVIAAEFAYLQKPLTVETLTRGVRSALDSGRSLGRLTHDSLSAQPAG